MENILTEEQLLIELNNFRDTLQNFDYSDIRNVTFINLNSLYYYIQTVENNPFQLQHQKLQQILDKIEPYIPLITDDGFLNIIDIEQAPDIQDLKQMIGLKKRLNFTSVARLITTDEQWQAIIDVCKNIYEGSVNV